MTFSLLLDCHRQMKLSRWVLGTFFTFHQDEPYFILKTWISNEFECFFSLRDRSKYTGYLGRVLGKFVWKKVVAPFFLVEKKSSPPYFSRKKFKQLPRYGLLKLERFDEFLAFYIGKSQIFGHQKSLLFWYLSHLLHGSPWNLVSTFLDI